MSLFHSPPPPPFTGKWGEVKYKEKQQEGTHNDEDDRVIKYIDESLKDSIHRDDTWEFKLLLVLAIDYNLVKWSLMIYYVYFIDRFYVYL